MNRSPESTVQAAALIRPATTGDVEAILALLSEYARMGNLLPRSRAEVTAGIEWFRVAESAGTVVACGALEIFTPDLAEIRSLVVAEDFKGTGTGRLVVERLIDDARGRGHRRLMALTYSPGFFHRLGFETVSKEMFPEKVWGICVSCYKFHRCDEIAVLKYL
ncbi:MAG: N-acetyltransferase [Gammaproteobacteria bacterium]|nr:N-acetyltransferase [Gammaproteobacteria bacterium]